MQNYLLSKILLLQSTLIWSIQCTYRKEPAFWQDSVNAIWNWWAILILQIFSVRTGNITTQCVPHRVTGFKRSCCSFSFSSDTRLTMLSKQTVPIGCVILTLCYIYIYIEMFLCSTTCDLPRSPVDRLRILLFRAVSLLYLCRSCHFLASIANVAMPSCCQGYIVRHRYAHRDDKSPWILSSSMKWPWKCSFFLKANL